MRIGNGEGDEGEEEEETPRDDRDFLLEDIVRDELSGLEWKGLVGRGEGGWGTEGKRGGITVEMGGGKEGDEDRIR
jgi:hypothetical protein